MHDRTIVNLTGMYKSEVRDIIRFQGGSLAEVDFIKDAHTGNLHATVPHSITNNVTIIAPIPNENLEPSECFMRLMIALTQLRSIGATEFHVVFIRPLFDGSGSRHSPSTLGFKIMADYINSRHDIRKITIMAPHSSHSECMFSPPRHIIPHHHMMNLTQELESATGNVVFVSPDIGGFYNANNFAANYTTQPPVVINDTMHPVGLVEMDTVVIVDDMIVSGKKLMTTYNAVSNYNPERVIVVVTHIMSSLAVTVLRELLMDPRVSVITSDTGSFTLEHERCKVSDIHTHLLEAFTENYETHTGSQSIRRTKYW